MTITLASPAFRLKGSLFTLTILQLLQTDLAAIERQLQGLVKQTPAFFNRTPIIIDLQKLTNRSAAINWLELQALLQRQGMIPVGVVNADSTQTPHAVAAGLALLTQGESTVANKPQPEQAVVNTKLVTQPVRSGQQVYARQGDLIVLASVGRGAELMADGHIHVYGTLRGKALAGVTGNTCARLFCQKLDAELISIAGYYQLSGEIDAGFAQQAVQVYLDGQELKIAAL